MIAPRTLCAGLIAALGIVVSTVAQATPPTPVLVAPADGAPVRQPITVDWDPVVDPSGPIVSYTWQVGTSAGFTTVVLEGSTSMLFEGVEAATSDQVSGLAKGTYFWRVKATSGTGDSAWSAVRTFIVTGLGPAPQGKPRITTPANNAKFHALETFPIRWSGRSRRTPLPAGSSRRAHLFLSPHPNDQRTRLRDQGRRRLG